MTLHIIYGASAGSARVHIYIERLMVETAFINRLVIVHGHLHFPRTDLREPTKNTHTNTHEIRSPN